MTKSFFHRAYPVAFDPDSTDNLTFRHNDPNRIVSRKKLDPLPMSGRQEILKNIVNDYV